MIRYLFSAALVLITTTAFAETFSTTGPKAAALSKALAATGAHTTTRVDASGIRVMDVACDAGYNQFLHKSYAQCSVAQVEGPQCNPFRPCPRFMQRKQYDVKGAKARALIGALNDAGLKSHGVAEVTTTQAAAVDCQIGVAGPRFTTCTITTR